MADALVSWLSQSLPEEIAGLTESYLTKLKNGDFEGLLKSDEAKKLFGHIDTQQIKAENLDDSPNWSAFISHRLSLLLSDPTQPDTGIVFFCIGYAALLAFLQSNVTGPPLSFSSAELLLPNDVAQETQKTTGIRDALLANMSIDGIAAYKLTPNIELLCLANAVLGCPSILKDVRPARWAKMRVTFVHQRLLSEVSSALQDVIYDDLDLLDDEIFGSHGSSNLDEAARIEFLLERATIHVHHGLDQLARADLENAKERRRFQYALTGLLGKRTKFQRKDISQLVVLAKSADQSEVTNSNKANGSSTVGNNTGEDPVTSGRVAATPAKLDLNDDTLLESISFTDRPSESDNTQTEKPLSPQLESLDPSSQPRLDALDSTILLTFASSITNTSPQNGLTREETLPYATRVLEGGSSNWQVYTQALLVRSRIEGYNARTVERGLLQLQALVDQVIADTSSSDGATFNDTKSDPSATSFLPRPKESESASASERLRFIFQLASPTRWDLEAELAARWVQLGGLKSALGIYERLQMWAEAALCWAATEREDNAKKIVRRQLYHATHESRDVTESSADDDETWEGPERVPPPLDAPRLYCILGDIEQSVVMYEKAWEVSGQRYARAQRSLGRLYISARDFVKAAEAYSKSLKVNQLNAGSWFALGCALLELAQFEKAAEAFSRCVQLDDTDAEAWSNFAASLLRIEPVGVGENGTSLSPAEDEEADVELIRDSKANSQKNRQDALKALKRAASLKHDSYRIWENVLIVSASLSPPDYTSILSAQKIIIDLRGGVDGERCIDSQALELLLQHVIMSSDHYDPAQPGLARLFVKFIDENVVPLITGSAELWQLVSRLALWRNKPSSSLDAEEKAWRVVTAQPGWDTESEEKWNAVVEATVRLCDSYESLGPKTKTEGMGAGEPIAKDWKFKARSAVRGILGKGKASWEGTEGWDRLQEVMRGLKS